MSLPATDLSRIPHEEPVFLNFRSEIVHPVCFAVVYWDASEDTLYAFEDQEAFERQCATAERHGAHIQVMSEFEATGWIARGGKAALYEVSVAGVAAFGNLKLLGIDY